MVEGCVSCGKALFVRCALAGPGCAINRTQAKPTHVGDRPKALPNARMSVALYQGPDVADWEKREGRV